MIRQFADARRHARPASVQHAPAALAAVVAQRAESAARGKRAARSALAWLLGLAIWVLIVYVVVDFKNFGPPLILTPGQAAPLQDLSPNPVTRALKLILIGVGAIVIAARTAQARVLLRHVNRYFLYFLALALASVVWSAVPDATVARYVGLCASVFSCFAFCLAGWHRQRMQNVVRPILTLLLLGSLIFGLMYPLRAIDQDDQGGWHGFAEQKNPFGELAAFGVLFWMHGWISGEIKWWRALIGAGISGACLVLSKSSTSLLATVLAILFMLLLLRTTPAMRRYTPYLVGAFAGLIITYALAVLDLVPGLATLLLEPVTWITGKDMTFSNRSQIWDIVKAHAWLHPILGTGYGGYWTGPVPSSPSYVVLATLYYWPSESHNGYLEMVNDLGFVGLAILIGYLVVYLRQSLTTYRLDRAQGALYLALFFQQAMTNLSESCWFSANGVLAVSIMTLATFSLARAHVELRRRPP